MPWDKNVFAKVKPGTEGASTSAESEERASPDLSTGRQPQEHPRGLLARLSSQICELQAQRETLTHKIGEGLESAVKSTDCSSRGPRFYP